MLKGSIKKLLFSILFSLTGKALINTSELNIYRNLDRGSILYSQLSEEKRKLIAPLLPYSKAQLAQDLFALAFTKSTSKNFFVEFGATDGVTLSNTWLLEKKLGWDGILAEPAKGWHADLRKNRSCAIDTKCVAKASGLKYKFLEVRNCSEGSPELSSIQKYANNGDWASDIRLKNSTCYEVESISLDDLLDQHDAPYEIQFLSLDTEGSELEILQGHNFKSRRINLICVEHNYVKDNRLAIKELLLDNGYNQKFEDISQWDDWYILTSR